MSQLPETQQRVKFYQTGTFTVGNRLLDETRQQRLVGLMTEPETRRR